MPEGAGEAMIAQADIQSLPIAANSVDLIFCDPPYSREYLPCYGWLAREAARVLNPGGFVLAMCVAIHLNEIYRMFDASGLFPYWLYTLFMTGAMSGVAWRHLDGSAQPISTRVKFVLAYSKGKSVSRTATTGALWDVGPDKQYHHWGQNVSHARYYLDCFSRPGDLVLDPFIGGGTTMIACELIGRRCIAMDIDPAALLTARDRLAHADILHTLPLFATTPLPGGDGGAR